MREVQDHFFRRAKEEHYLSRAAYKLLEIDDKKRILQPGDRVLDCGCAPGAWLQVAAQRIGERGIVLGIDLKRVKQKIASNVLTIEADLTQLSADDILAQLGTQQEQFDVILSDMAPSTSGDPEGDHFRSVRLCEAVLDRCSDLLRPGGNLVMKVFEGAAYMDLVRRCHRLFQESRGFKPQASRSESTEMYIVAHRWRAVNEHAQDLRPRDVNVLAPPRPSPRPGWSNSERNQSDRTPRSTE